ncbi:MAG TPA: hypothetical protein VIL88_04745 [Devosia sp.]|jgi:hypothetical protein|uniref:hypothetical protein n=1 Tax=Devosia sp. TaxID=1871048 RepID=UPI002F9579A8
MIREEDEAYLAQYRALLKAWTMAVGGFTNDDSDELHRKLEAGQDELARIAQDHPEKSYDVDMLIHARSRPWGGFAADRLPRPPHRQP